MSPRTGRPKSEKPKTYQVKACVDEEIYEALMNYCEREETTVAAVMRKGIKLILNKEK